MVVGLGPYARARREGDRQKTGQGDPPDVSSVSSSRDGVKEPRGLLADGDVQRAGGDGDRLSLCPFWDKGHGRRGASL